MRELEERNDADDCTRWLYDAGAVFTSGFLCCGCCRGVDLVRQRTRARLPNSKRQDDQLHPGLRCRQWFRRYARAIGRHLSRHIPGNPTLVMQNMPGAGSSIAGAYLYSVAPKDGMTIGALLPDALLAKLMGDKTPVAVDPNQFQYLAGAERGTRLCVTSASSKIKTYEDTLTDKVMIGATAPGGPTYDYAMWHKNTTGAKFEIIGGYKGTADLYLAIRPRRNRRYVRCRRTALKTQRASFLRDHKLNLLAQDGIEPEPELAALGVPQTWKYIKDPEDRRAVELIVGFQQAIGKAYLVPPGVPPQAVENSPRRFCRDAAGSGVPRGCGQDRHSDQADAGRAIAADRAGGLFRPTGSGRAHEGHPGTLKRGSIGWRLSG